MKVTQQSEPKFIPVVITLESQEEVDILISLLGSVTGSGDVRVMLNQLYTCLTPFACHVDARAGVYFNTSIRANHLKF